MKQIFDWLREQMREHIYTDFTETDSIEFETAISLVDEAEAKWCVHAMCYLDSPCEYQNEELRVDEADCCEWVIGNFCAKVECLGKVQEVGNPHNYIFCPYCGKPIKISEVE